MELRITAKAPTEAEARDLIVPVEEELRDLLGDVIYGADVKSLEEVAFALMEAQGLTFGTAESCTGGLVAKRMTDLPGASGRPEGRRGELYRRGKAQCARRTTGAAGSIRGRVPPGGPRPWPGAPAGYWGAIWPVSTTGVAGRTRTTGGTPWDWYMWPWPARSSAMCRSSIWEGGAQWCAAGPPFTPSIW